MNIEIHVYTLTSQVELLKFPFPIVCETPDIGTLTVNTLVNFSLK